MARAARQRLPSGHEDEFVNEVEDDFQCLICHLPLKEPVLTRCGHRFCKGCLEEHFRRYDLQYNSERKLIICKVNFSWNLVISYLIVACFSVIIRTVRFSRSKL